MKIDSVIYKRLKAISELQDIKTKLDALIKELEPQSVRSTRQNNSLHLYLKQVAEQLQQKGLTLQDVVREIKKAEIMPTTNLLKEVVWKPIQQIMLGKDSTTKLTKDEVDSVYKACNHFFSKPPFHIGIPFPSEEYDVAELTHKNLPSRK